MIFEYKENVNVPIAHTSDIAVHIYCNMEMLHYICMEILRYYNTYIMDMQI